MAEVNEAFEEWRAREGNAIAEEISESLKASSSVLSVQDGSHAVWHEGSLGLLLVLPFEHAMAFAAESITGDFENSPVHSHVFTTISDLILRSASAVSWEDYD